MKWTGGSEKGGVRGLWLTLFVLVLAALAVAALVRWYLGAPLQTPTPTGIPAPSSSGFKGDPAKATDKLLKALNQKLADMDLLKLLDREVDTRPATVRGKVFPVYREVFRLPSRYTPEGIAAHLDEAARLLGATTTSYEPGIFSFSYHPEWTPVIIAFVRANKPRVCLIIDDGGYQKGETLERLYAFKVPVTLAIIPGAEFSKSLARELPAHGIEVMCHMPMEGHEKIRPGAYRNLLKRGMNSRAVEKEMEESLGELSNCRGLNNHQGSLASTDPELMWDVCQILKARDLYIIDSRTTTKSVIEPIAKKAGVPFSRRDVFLDNVEEPEAILRQLDQLVARAKRKGLAVGIGHFKTVTLKTLGEAIPRLKEQGIQFVYASEVVK